MLDEIKEAITKIKKGVMKPLLFHFIQNILFNSLWTALGVHSQSNTDTAKVQK